MESIGIAGRLFATEGRVTISFVYFVMDDTVYILFNRRLTI